MNTGKLITPSFVRIYLFSIVFSVGCFKNLPIKSEVYNNNFETGSRFKLTVVSFAGNVDSAKIIDFNGGKIFGNFNNNRIELDLDSLPQHNTLKIEFDLYIHDKWDGDYLIPGGNNIPDAWQLVIDGYPLYVTTFSNGLYGQSFPNNYQAGALSNPARSNAWNTNLPGICALRESGNGSSMYKIEMTTAHTSDKVKLACNDALQPFGSFCQKSWSLDNIKITAIQYQ